jgi:hypothetical protein
MWWITLIAALLLTLGCMAGAWFTMREKPEMTRQAWLALALVGAERLIASFALPPKVDIR